MYIYTMNVLYRLCIMHQIHTLLLFKRENCWKSMKSKIYETEYKMLYKYIPSSLHTPKINGFLRMMIYAIRGNNMDIFWTRERDRDYVESKCSRVLWPKMNDGRSIHQVYDYIVHPSTRTIWGVLLLTFMRRHFFSIVDLLLYNIIIYY